jgi:hypothetical protein
VCDDRGAVAKRDRYVGLFALAVTGILAARRRLVG